LKRTEKKAKTGVLPIQDNFTLFRDLFGAVMNVF
jgi:hypothetical protein